MTIRANGHFAMPTGPGRKARTMNIIGTRVAGVDDDGNDDSDGDVQNDGDADHGGVARDGDSDANV